MTNRITFDDLAAIYDLAAATVRKLTHEHGIAVAHLESLREKHRAVANRNAALEVENRALKGDIRKLERAQGGE